MSRCALAPHFAPAPSTAALRPEAALLLAYLRPPSADPATAGAAAGLTGEVNWDGFLHLTQFHNLQPMAYHYLKQWPGFAPAHVLKQLKYHYHYNHFHNWILLQVLGELLGLLGEQRIPVLVLKGPPLAHQLYEHPAQRFITDLDLLIHPGDVAAVRELLTARGYVRDQALDARAERRRLKVDCECPFTHPRHHVQVELHWRFLPRHTPDGFAGLDAWSASRLIRLQGLEMTVLSPEAAFVYHCIHGGEKHQWHSLKLIGDLARMIDRAPGLDWDEVFRLARRAGKTRTVLLALHLVHELLGVPLPPQAGAPPTRVTALLARVALVRGRLFRPQFDLPGFAEWLHYLPQRLSAGPAARRSRWRRARLWLCYLRATLEPEFNDRAFLPDLPAGLAFIHPLMRVLRLTTQHKLALLRRLQ